MTDFDASAKTWDENPIRAERANAVADVLRQELKLTGKMSALEYGCGTGLLSFALQPFLGPITLADSSTGMLEVLREKISLRGVRNMTPLRLDLSTDPLPAGRFDLIYTLMTLHHIPDTLDTLRKFHALLKPAGFLCIADLDKEDGSFHSHDFTGHHGFDRQDLKAMLLQTGFAGVRFTTPFVMDKHNRNYSLFLSVAEKLALTHA
jgi:ubiquinone/menaquinone biosynthesis C-methylase UbiE